MIETCSCISLSTQGGVDSPTNNWPDETYRSTESSAPADEKISRNAMIRKTSSPPWRTAGFRLCMETNKTNVRDALTVVKIPRDSDAAAAMNTASTTFAVRSESGRNWNTEKRDRL